MLNTTDDHFFSSGFSNVLAITRIENLLAAHVQVLVACCSGWVSRAFKRGMRHVARMRKSRDAKVLLTYGQMTFI